MFNNTSLDFLKTENSERVSENSERQTKNLKLTENNVYKVIFMYLLG